MDNTLSSDKIIPEEIENFFDDYIRAFSKRDVKYIMENIYNNPISIVKGGTVIPLNDSAIIEKSLVDGFNQLNAVGYDHTIKNNLENLQEQADNKITITLNYSRLNKQHQFIGDKEIRTKYSLERKDTGYRIAQIIL